jgi:lipid II:glycine glycyltransferase (peptidoglycan interpeptide bridge formation enzyme)
MKISMRQTQPGSEFDAFIAGHPYGHYMKTEMWAREMEAEGNHPRFFVFTDEDSRTVGTAMAVYKKWLGQPYLYIPWGPCIDYEDPDTVKQVFTSSEGLWCLPACCLPENRSECTAQMS